ncbi:hypothetical protein J6590_037654 [Homalodisca vitripennis]|nr:hypothetical protein J6590_037654 [Homalodisca vitripennis]
MMDEPCSAHCHGKRSPDRNKLSAALAPCKCRQLTRGMTGHRSSSKAVYTMDEPCSAHCHRKGPPDRNKLSAALAPCKCRRLSRGMTGRRSSSIGCRSLLHRRSSVGLWYITCQDPVRGSSGADLKRLSVVWGDNYWITMEIFSYTWSSRPLILVPLEIA